MNYIEDAIDDFQEEQPKRDAKEWFSKLIQEEQYVGDLYSTNYESSKVLVHDEYREKVGGIPSLCFLIATRINLKEEVDFKREDSSVILLRVMDSTAIPQDREVEKARVQMAQGVTGLTEKNWDHKDYMDVKTKVYFGYAGIACRVVGTFYVEQEENGDQVRLKFGTDLSNFYSNMALKVYKPKGGALKLIANYIDPKNLESHKAEFGNTEAVRLGKVRYASTHRGNQGIDDVPTFIYPADLLSQKTALFGMTRTGKSNTTKIIAKSVFELRHPKKPNQNKALRIGQVIFDPNGEYANENIQDRDGTGNPNALKNIWRKNADLKTKSDELKTQYQESTDREDKKRIWNEIRDIAESEVVTYGILPHPKDPFRRLMKINFFEDENIQIGKEIIDFATAEQSAQYFKNFRQVIFQPPQESDFENQSEFQGQLRRYERRLLVYRALLSKAGFNPPNRNVRIRGMFNSDLRNAMLEYEEKRFTKKQGLINAAGQTLSQDNVTWDSLSPAFEGLFHFLSTADFNNFNQDYIANHREDDSEDATGEGWAEADLENLLEMFKYSKAINLIGGVSVQHTTTIGTDYAQDIYNELKDGKLVIVDQSSGEPELNKTSAMRIMWKIFKENQKSFRDGDEEIPEILVYVEEAHNILPAGSDLDLSDVWVRTAKEGSKYKLGLVYATQEVSSIQKNILKNTANWFISHLNNTDETKELTKYYDFVDFEPSIRKAQDKGFLRVKTLNSPFIVPMQIDKFELKISE